MKTLETDRLILRDWSLDDIGCEVYDEGVIRYLIEVQNNYAVILKENGMIIGTIGLNEDADNNPDVIECVIQNANNIAKELSYLCHSDDKRSQHIAEKFRFQYIKTFHVQENPTDAPKDFYYYRLKL